MVGYYVVKKSKREYKGYRYFYFNSDSEKVIQVTINCGEQKKGRPAMFGVGMIHRLSFLTNYLSMGYVEKCSKKMYDKHFDMVVGWLRTKPVVGLPEIEMSDFNKKLQRALDYKKPKHGREK